MLFLKVKKSQDSLLFIHFFFPGWLAPSGCAAGRGTFLLSLLLLFLPSTPEPGADEPIRLEPGISLFICRSLDGSGGVEGSNLLEPRISVFICHSLPTRGCAGDGDVALSRNFFIYLSIHPMAEPGADGPIRLEPGISLFICRPP